MKKAALMTLLVAALTGCGSEEPREVRIIRDQDDKIVHVKHQRMDLYVDVTSDEQISNKDLVDGLAQLHKSAKDDIRAIGLFRKMLNDEQRLLDGLNPQQIDQMAKLLAEAYEKGADDALKAKDRTVKKVVIEKTTE